MKSSSFPSAKDNETTALVSALRKVEVVTASVFDSLLSFISRPKAESKLNGWSLVSKLVNSKRVGCYDDETSVNEFEKVDVALPCLLCHETSKFGHTKQVENVRNELQNLELCIQDYEGKLEYLFRRLIKTRVALLNILNN